MKNNIENVYTSENNIEKNLYNFNISKKVELILWEECPNCEWELFEWKCSSCGYWLWEKYFLEKQEKIDKKNENEVMKREVLSNKNKWNWKKYEIFIDWASYDYFHYNSNIKENEAKIIFRYKWKKYFFEVKFLFKELSNFQDETSYKSLSFLKLKEPKNFDGKHYVFDFLSKKPVFFDFLKVEKLAEKILREKKFNKFI